MSDRLLCFPCAGGSADNYRIFSHNITADVIRMEYTGHWTRYHETQYRAFEELLEDAESYSKRKIGLDDRVFLFGHSMGAWVAFEVAGRLLAKGYQVKALFVSACVPIQLMDVSKVTFQSDEDVKAFLRMIRQVPENVLNSEFFEDNLLPSIKNDFRMIADYKKNYQNDTGLNCPILCFRGTEDPLVQTMDGWEKLTLNECSTVCFPGEHFFLYERNNYRQIAEYINDAIRMYGEEEPFARK